LKFIMDFLNMNQLMPINMPVTEYEIPGGGAGRTYPKIGVVAGVLRICERA